MVKLCNAPSLKREMVVHEEPEIMPMKQKPVMELFIVSMDLTLLHCPLCLRPLKPPVYEVRIHLVHSADRARCKFLDLCAVQLICAVQGGHLACADCRGEHSGNQWQCQKCECGCDFKVRNTAMDPVLSSVSVECPHDGCGLYVTYHKLSSQ